MCRYRRQRLSLIGLFSGPCDFDSAGHSNRYTMKDDKEKPERDPAKMASKNPRRDRLKQALRENLKRRKSQARARDDVSTTSSKGDDASPHDGQGRNQAKERGEN